MYELLGQVYAAQKADQKAEECFRKAISIDKNRMSAYSHLGRLYASRKSFGKAIQEFENSLKSNPGSAESHVFLGMAYQAGKENKKAAGHYREALKIDPGLALASNNLAWILCEDGENLDEALKLATAATEIVPQSAVFADTLGWIYYKRGAYRTAQDILSDCVNKDSQNPDFNYHLGMVLMKTGDKPGSREHLQRALKSPSLSSPDAAKKALEQLK
ncbi:MAG: uncharacterized protein H6Q04_3507 [Acidobacteria bacterium]|nr:uncharacterized protein [Acidobacteriota bacterium]